MWKPQAGPQTAAVLTAEFIDELLFGGARGGGKSDFLLGDFGQDVGKGCGPNWRGVMFRKTYPELEELIARSQEIYPAWFDGCKWNEQSKTWRFPDGATLKMRYLEREQDADRYQGHQYTWIGWDELTHWATLKPYHKLKATLRSAHGVEGKRIRASANPGGAGHNAVKSYFGIDTYPLGNEILTDDSGMRRMFIRSRLSDNRILMDSDPGYVGRLRGTGSAEQVRMWLDGDWDVIEGAFFDNWSAERHVVAPFTIPDFWVRFRSLDWGSASPFSGGWWAVCSDDYTISGDVCIPRGCLVRYREWYGSTGEPNKGLKLTAEQVAQGILERTPSGEKIAYTVADPSMFKEDGGPSLAERFSKVGVILRPGDNARVPQHGHIGGWDQMRQRLNGDDDGRPMIVCFKTCTDSIRTIPVLQHDIDKPEDLDTESEDHAADEWRYACMSRPYRRDKPRAALPITARRSFTEEFDAHRKRKRLEADARR